MRLIHSVPAEYVSFWNCNSLPKYFGGWAGFGAEAVAGNASWRISRTHDEVVIYDQRAGVRIEIRHVSVFLCYGESR